MSANFQHILWQMILNTHIIHLLFFLKPFAFVLSSNGYTLMVIDVVALSNLRNVHHIILYYSHYTWAQIYRYLFPHLLPTGDALPQS
jgi:hypothetical protein